jgi:hypothetical protein
MLRRASRMLTSFHCRQSILLKRKAVSGVTLLVPILSSDKTPNYPPIPLLIKKDDSLYQLSRLTPQLSRLPRWVVSTNFYLLPKTGKANKPDKSRFLSVTKKTTTFLSYPKLKATTTRLRRWFLFFLHASLPQKSQYEAQLNP